MPTRRSKTLLRTTVGVASVFVLLASFLPAHGAARDRDEPGRSLWWIDALVTRDTSSATLRLGVRLDRNMLEDVLSRVSTRDRGLADPVPSAQTLSLPMPDGSIVDFAVRSTPVPAHQSPAVRALRGRSLTGDLTARIEWTGDGLHAVVSGSEGSVYLDPDPMAGADAHVVYHRRDAGRPLVVGGDLPLKAIRQIETEMAEKAERTPEQRKISSRLLDASRSGLAPPSIDADEVGRVLVDIRAVVTFDLLVRIEALGGTVIDSVARYRAIRARMPLEAIESLAAEDAVQRIEPADIAISNTSSSTEPIGTDDPGLSEPLVVRTIEVPAGPGAVRRRLLTRLGMEEALEYAASRRPAPEVIGSPPIANTSGTKENTSEGDIAHDAANARSQFGVSGTGIGIGVLSNGIRTLADRQATGDVPALVTVLPGQEGRGDEGTAMLEIVHDLAPGAHLYFATALGGQARFAANIEALCEAGADVVVDDVFYFAEGAFQDDIVARGINSVTASGCFYFTPAANSGNLDHGTAGVWEGDFEAAEEMPPGIEGIAHDFGSGNSNPIVELGLRLQLKWTDPLEASSNDYDLYLFDETLTTLLDSSTDAQTGSENPYEFIPTEKATVGSRLVVVKASGDDRYLRLNTIRGRLGNATAGAIFGHMGAKSAITTTAVDARAAGGTGGIFDGSESVEDFSSDGPRRIFYEPDGTPITSDDFSSNGGELLQKPDVAAADGVSTATPGFGDFHGTSAAAPHAAAIGALVLEAAGGPAGVTLEMLRSALVEASIDIEAEGVDRTAGAGIPMAPAAVAELRSADIHHAPNVATAIEDQTLVVLDDASLFDLSGRFRDRDGDALSYSALSSDPAIAMVSVAGSTLSLAPLARGSATVIVRSTDPGGLSALMTFVVTVDRVWGQTDYDTDGDGLIEVANLEQLDAMRYDLDGDAVEDAPEDGPLYFEAFADAARDMGCLDRCTGYELTRDLDFADAKSYAAGEIARGWSEEEGASGWEPIGEITSESPVDGDRFTADFDGNGHTIANLFIDRDDRAGVGLFGLVGGTRLPVRAIRDLRLVGVNVTGRTYVGGLVGAHVDDQSGGWRSAIRLRRIGVSRGRVSGADSFVGGLAGIAGQVDHSHAQVSVSGFFGVGGLIGGTRYPFGTVAASYATGSVTGKIGVGGLVGSNFGEIVACYATGAVTGETEIGGLVGANYQSVKASYATGRVKGRRETGGFIGYSHDRETLFANYWDIETSGTAVGVGSDDSNGSGSIDADEPLSVGVAAQTTAELAGPRGYRGIYANWNTAVERSPRNDYFFGVQGQHPWHFGSASQYPALNAALDDGDDLPTWQNFGQQVRERPELSLAASNGKAALTWSTPETAHWDTPPKLGYAVYRNGEILVANVEGTTFEDVPPADGTSAYTYQVAVTLGTGEPVRSNIVAVRNRPPASPSLANQVARVGESFRYAFSAATDPEGHAVTYRASGVPEWLAFDASARTFSGTPAQGEAGSSRIQVTVTDNGTPPLTSATTFELTVNPSGDDNQAPEIEGEIADLRLSTGDVEEVQVANAFRDPDDDALSYRASVADAGIATVFPVGDALSIRARGSGATTVTVTASDGALTAELSFAVEVANAAPRAAEPIPALSLVQGSPARFDVADSFVDPDGDPLSYAVESSDPHVATVENLGSRLTVSPVAGGSTVLTVSATDRDGSNSTASQTVQVVVRIDYDSDDDGLVEVANLTQLDAIRHDLNGDAAIGGGPPRNVFTPDAEDYYAAAFPYPVHNSGCLGGCIGYELTADLDLDTNGNGRADPGDRFWNDGSGWVPLGLTGPDSGHVVILYPEAAWRAVFEGNGHTISGLFIDRNQSAAIGLFGVVWDVGQVRGIRLVDVNVDGRVFVGSAIGLNQGTVDGLQVTGTVGGHTDVGGLVGVNRGSVTSSAASVSVSGAQRVGGLVGGNYHATITRSYATGPATVKHASTYERDVGGLVGENGIGGHISASYATGTASGPGPGVGGLVGNNWGRVVASYTTSSLPSAEGHRSYPVTRGGLIGIDRGDTRASYSDRLNDGGIAIGYPASGIGSRTTADLQRPSGYAGIYRDWNLDLDGSGSHEDTWGFATGSYPVLKLDDDRDGQATWQEFGPQRGPTDLTVTAGQTDGTLVVTWSPPADTGVAEIAGYELQRKIGERAFERVSLQGATDTAYIDRAPTQGTARTYRVRAATAHGDTNWSSPASTAPGAPDLTASAENARVILGWTEPADTGTSELIGYQYQQSDDGGNTWDPEWTAIPGGDDVASQFTVEGLRNGRVYEFELRAVNGSGPGAGSVRVAVSLGVLGPPRGFSAMAGDGEVTLRWSAPEGIAASAIVGYEYRQSVDGGATWMPDWTRIGGGPVEVHVLRDLDNATAYTFELRALNPGGPGDPARTHVSTPPIATAAIPDLTLAALGDATTLRLARFFAVAPGGTLVYTVVSDNPALVGAIVDGDLLSVISNDEGEDGVATITVTATDDEGRRIELTFTVTVERMASFWRRLGYWLFVTENVDAHSGEAVPGPENMEE